MMTDQQLFGNFSDGGLFATGKAFDDQHGLILMWREADFPGGFLAEMQKDTQLLPKFRQGFVLCLGNDCPFGSLIAHS